MLSLTLKWTNRHHGLDEGRKFLRDTVARSDSPPCAASRPGLSSVAKHHTFGICRLRGPKSLNCRSLSPKSERASKPKLKAVTRSLVLTYSKILKLLRTIEPASRRRGF